MSNSNRSVLVAPDIASAQRAIKGLYRRIGDLATSVSLGAIDSRVSYMVMAVAVSNSSGAAITFGFSSVSSAPATTVIFTDLSVPAGSTVVLPFNPDGWFVATMGEELKLTASATTGSYIVTVRQIFNPAQHNDLL